MNIIFRTKGQLLIRGDDSVIAANGQKYLNAVFETDSEWEDCVLTACFGNGESAYHIILEQDSCRVPYEVLGAGEFFVSLIGTKKSDSSVRITTEQVKVSVSPGPVLEADNASVPTVTEIEQLKAIAGHALDIAESIRQDASNGVFDGADGKNGIDGMNGATGPQGEAGPQGPKGEQGPKGDPYTLTEEDKAEIIAELSKEGDSLEIVSSVDEMTDTSKKYGNKQTGTVWEYTGQTVVIPEQTVKNFTNVFKPETATVGSRWSSSSKAPTTGAGDPCVLSDFISVDLDWTKEHIIRIKNGQLHGTSSNAGIAYFSSNTNDSQIFLVNNLGAVPTEEADGVYAYKLGYQNGSQISGLSGTKYIRCIAVIYDGAQLMTMTSEKAEKIIITIDEPITYTTIPESTETISQWTDTGIAYDLPYDEAIAENSADITVLKTDVSALKEDVEELKENSCSGTNMSQSGAVWYALGDSIISGYLIGGPSETWVAHVLKYNGYDGTHSRNLGVAGIGFVREDPTNGNVIQDIVDANDFSAVDLVTVAAGINDWQNDCSIDGVKAAMVSCFNKILSDNPYCKIIFITPFNKNRGSKETNWALGYEQNGITLEDFVAGQISACKDYGIEIIDMTHSSVINRENLTRVLVDNTHPNTECHKSLGKELARKISFA